MTSAGPSQGVGSGSGAGLGKVDAGVLWRALELGLGQPPPVSLGALATGEQELAKLIRALEGERELTVRRRHIAPSDAALAMASGAGLVIAGRGGWLALRGGQATWVTSTAEQRVPLSTRTFEERGLSPVVEALVIEPRFPLQLLRSLPDRPLTPWRRLRALIRLDASDIAALVVFAAVLGCLSLAVPVAVQVLVNTIAFGALLQPLVVLAGLLLGVLLLSASIQVAEWVAVEVLQRRLFVRVAEEFARRIPLVSWQYHQHHDVSALAARLLEVSTLQKTVASLLVDGLGLLLQMLAGLLLLGFYHPLLLAFDAVLVLGVMMVLAMGYRAVPTAIAESGAKYSLVAWLQAVASAPLLFRRRSEVRLVATQADDLTRRYLHARRAHYRRVLFQQVGGVGTQVLAMVMLLGLGGWLVMQRELTLGQLVAAELVVGSVGAGFAKLGKHAESLYDLIASLDKLGKVVDLPMDAGPGSMANVDASPAPLSEDESGRSIQLDSVLVHPDAPPLTLELSSASRLAIPREPASWSQSCVEVLSGLRAPTRGQVRVAGVDSLSAPTWLCETVLLVRSDVLRGDVLGNLRLWSPNLTEAQGRELLVLVGLGYLVEDAEGHEQLTLPSITLSPEEAARLALARALASDARWVVLDGVIDQAGLHGAELSRLLDRVLGPTAPWSVVVVTNQKEVSERCALSLDWSLGQVRPIVESVWPGMAGRARAGTTSREGGP